MSDSLDTSENDAVVYYTGMNKPTDCGEAGHAEGACGTTSCLPSKLRLPDVGSFGAYAPPSPLYAAVGYVGTDDHGANPPVGTIAHLYAPLPSNTPLFTLAKLPRKLEIPPPPAEMTDVVFAEGWNQCCDAFFGGLPAQEPVVITITEKRESLTDEQERALCEAYCNTASDAYFKARPQLDSQVNRRTFYAGHRKAWVEHEAAHSITDKKD